MKKEIKKIGIFLIYFLIVLTTLSGALAFDITDNLKGFYRFEEGSGVIAIDSSNYNHNGIIIGTANYVNSKEGNGTGNYSLNFDGINNFVDLYIVNNPVTMSFWFDYDTVGQFESLIQYGWGSGDQKTFCVEWNLAPNFELMLSVRTSPANFVYYTIINAVNLSSGWNHLVVMWEGTTRKIYLNGIERDLIILAQSGSNPSSYDLLSSDTFLIGRGEHAGYYYYDGRIDEVALFDTFLTQEDVTDIYENGIGEEEVKPEEPIIPEEIEAFVTLDFESTSNVIFLFVLVFAYLGVMALGFAFKNGGFISFGFFIGIILGFMLSGFHMFLTLLFLFMNIGILWSFIKKGK